MTFEWEQQSSDDLSSTWLECDIGDGVYLCVSGDKTADRWGYRPSLCYGGEIDECVEGPFVNSRAEAQDIAVELFYGWCVQTSIETLCMALEWER